MKRYFKKQKQNKHTQKTPKNKPPPTKKSPQTQARHFNQSKTEKFKLMYTHKIPRT